MDKILNDNKEFTKAPWAKTTDKEGWFKQVLCGAVRKNDITHALPMFIRDRIIEAALNQEHWLLHPSIAPLINPDVKNNNMVPQLLAWVIGHTLESCYLLEIPASLWLPDGSYIELKEGKSYYLEYSKIKQSIDFPLGSVIPIESVYHWTPFIDKEQVDRESLLKLLVWWELVATEFPLWTAWVRDAVSVASLLPRQEGKTLSGSNPEMPGHFWLSMPTDRCDGLETLIHESAHCHLLLEEMNEPLIATGGCNIEIYSPLRKTERPLRGAFFAAHAIAHMLAFHSSFFEKIPIPDFHQRIHELTVSLLPLLENIKKLMKYFTERGRMIFAHLERMMESLA